MKNFNEILDKHSILQTCREIYKIDEDIEMTVNQEENKVVIWAYNKKSDRFVNLGTKRFKKLIDGFKLVASDLYSKGDYYYITIDTSDKNSMDDNRPYELDIASLKGEIELLKANILRLEGYNKKLENDVEKYRADYLYYHGEYAKLMDKDFKRTLENLDQLKKNSLMHNARGAGRRAKFTDAQVEDIKKLRENGSTIKEIASRYNCSVGLIHKLINEK